MASINKLSIRGVRSFSPDDEEQVISFCFPVTIIVGANGCGKTTVIESLKYAVTGSLPPGNKSGQAFVHDPKSVGQTSVKANIKLRFTNRAGNSMVVVRSMEVTQKKTTMTFKALDGILRTVDPRTGERISMSHKCSELDRQIPALMGVSKPILEHVQFCHQEDSSWPLQEGAVLKKRFDDIFDSTRYAKALEALRKCRLEYQGVAKDHKAELMGLAAHKSAAQGFQVELEEAQTKIDNIDEDMGTLDELVQAEDSKMQEAQKVIAQVDDVNEELDEARNQIDKEQMLIAQSASMLETDWTDQTKYTERDLREQLVSFDDAMGEDEQRRTGLEQKYRNLQKELKTMQQQEVQMNSEIGKLTADREAYQVLLKERISKMSTIAQEHRIELNVSQQTQGSLIGTQQSAVSTATAFTTGRDSVGMSQESTVSISPEDLEVFQKAVKSKERGLRNELQEHRSRHQEEEDTILAAISDLNAKKKAIESDVRRTQEKINASRRELQTISAQTSSVSRVRKSDIDDAKRQAETFSKELDTVTKDPRRNEIPTEIRKHEETIDGLKRVIEEDREALQQLRRCAEEQNKIDILQTQIAQDVEVLEESLRDNSFLLQKYQLQVPDAKTLANEDDRLNAMESLVTSAQDKREQCQQDWDKANDKQGSIQKQVSEKSALLGHNQCTIASLRDQIVRLSAEDRGVKKIERIVSMVRRFEIENLHATTSVDVNIHPQQLLEHMTNMIGEFSTEDDKPESIARTMKKLAGLSTKQDENGEIVGIVCPCCSRDMGPSDIEIFQNNISRLSDPEESPIMLSDKSLAERNRTAVANYERWRNAINQGMNDYLDNQRVTKDLQEKESVVQDEEKEVKELQSALIEAELKTGDWKMGVNDLRELVDMTSRLRDDATRIADKQSQIVGRESQLTFLAPSSGGRDLRTVERNVNARGEEKENLMNTIARLNKEMSALNNHISTLSTQASNAEQLAKQKEQKYASDQQASVKKVELSNTITECDDELKKLNVQMAPIDRHVNKKEAEKERIRKSDGEEEARMTKELNSFLADIQSFNYITERIDRYLSSDKEERLGKMSADLEQLSIDSKATEAKLRLVRPDLEELSTKVNNQLRHKKTITENIALIGRMKDLDKLEQRVSELEEKSEAIEGSATCSEDHRNAAERKKALVEKRARREGRKGGIIEQIRGLKMKLEAPDYKDVEERHRQMMIKHETTIIAVSDLEKYHAALDKALLRYHGMKITDINKIIRELWALTYKGEDIQNIELVSGQESGSRASRSYNYRVVMTKGNTQMDMRGRCSAGQRVLASIVIRLALAETFCLNCGVMALDEPTTNLDYANKRGLAIALAQIIAARAQAHNFQLVIITHDEDFVSMMKNELSTQAGFDMPERYYQISRVEGTDGVHYSKINAIDWDEL